MFSVPLEALPLSKREQAWCRRADLVNAAQILFASPAELSQSRQADEIRQAAAWSQAPPSSSVLEILTCDGARGMPTNGAGAGEDDGHSISPREQSATLSTGDGAMDGLLGGGVRRGCLTEIVGESSSGKTQLGIQTAVFAALGLASLGGQAPAPVKNGRNDLYAALRGHGIRPLSHAVSVAVLNSGGSAIGQMMTRRMVELTDLLVEERWTSRQAYDSTGTVRPPRSQRSGVFQKEADAYSLEETQQLAREQLLGNIHLASPTDYESLEHAVSYALPALSDQLQRQAKASLGLVVVDDLPELLIDEADANCDSQRGWTVRRSRMVCEISDRLKRLAVYCASPTSPPAAIVVMNQVVDTFARNHDVLLPLLTQPPQEYNVALAGPPPLSSALQDGFFNGVMASVDVDAIRGVQRALAQSAGVEDETIKRVCSTTKMAALGHSWVNCLNVRILLARTRQTVGTQDQSLVVRKAVSVLNPFARAGDGWEPSVEYVIQRRGFTAICDRHVPPGSSGRSSVYGGLAHESLDEEQLWSSVGADITAADLSSLMDSEELGHVGDSDSLHLSDWEA